MLHGEHANTKLHCQGAFISFFELTWINTTASKGQKMCRAEADSISPNNLNLYWQTTPPCSGMFY